MVKRKRKSIVKLAYLLGILILFVFFCGLQYCDGGKQHTYTQLAGYVCVCVICEAFSTEKMRIECTSTKHKHCEKYIVPFSTFTHQNSFVQLPRTNRTKKKMNEANDESLVKSLSVGSMCFRVCYKSGTLWWLCNGPGFVEFLCVFNDRLALLANTVCVLSILISLSISITAFVFLALSSTPISIELANHEKQR